MGEGAGPALQVIRFCDASLCSGSCDPAVIQRRSSGDPAGLHSLGGAGAAVLRPAGGAPPPRNHERLQVFVSHSSGVSTKREKETNFKKSNKKKNNQI